jgi:hypothetical protein
MIKTLYVKGDDADRCTESFRSSIPITITGIDAADERRVCTGAITSMEYAPMPSEHNGRQWRVTIRAWTSMTRKWRNSPRTNGSMSHAVKAVLWRSTSRWLWGVAMFVGCEVARRRLKKRDLSRHKSLADRFACVTLASPIFWNFFPESRCGGNTASTAPWLTVSGSNCRNKALAAKRFEFAKLVVASSE